jgi:hypothetical protein
MGEEYEGPEEERASNVSLNWYWVFVLYSRVCKYWLVCHRLNSGITSSLVNLFRLNFIIDITLGILWVNDYYMPARSMMALTVYLQRPM